MDDLFAISALKLLYPDAEVIRTRDDEVIKQADIVVDVGGKNRADQDQFDHHQPGGAGKRENNVPYASFGLVWKKYGIQLSDGDIRVADVVDKKLVQPIDAADCGYLMFKTTQKGLSPYFFSNAIKSLAPTWRDDYHVDDIFTEMIPFVQRVLRNEIQKAHYFFLDIELVKKTYKEAENRKIIVLEHSLPWKSVLSQKKEPVYVIHPDQNTGEWVIACVILNPRSDKYRKLLPKAWGGKKKEELEKITGVKGAEFVHTKLFIGKAWTKEAAVAMAEKALKA